MGSSSRRVEEGAELQPTRSAAFLMFTGLTFVWSVHACVTYQQSCKSLSHCNYLQLLLEGRPPFPGRRDQPANPLVCAKGRIRPRYYISGTAADGMTQSSPAFVVFHG